VLESFYFALKAELQVLKWVEQWVNLQLTGKISLKLTTTKVCVLNTAVTVLTFLPAIKNNLNLYAGRRFFV